MTKIAVYPVRIKTDEEIEQELRMEPSTPIHEVMFNEPPQIFDVVGVYETYWVFCKTGIRPLYWAMGESVSPRIIEQFSVPCLGFVVFERGAAKIIPSHRVMEVTETKQSE